MKQEALCAVVLFLHLFKLSLSLNIEYCWENLEEFGYAKNRSGRVSLTQITRNNSAKMNKGQDFCCQISEIWSQGCEKPHASNVLFESPLASHSHVTKSLSSATVPFLHSHNLQFCRVLLRVLLAWLRGRTQVWPRKRLNTWRAGRWSLFEDHKSGVRMGKHEIGRDCSRRRKRWDHQSQWCQPPTRPFAL